MKYAQVAAAMLSKAAKDGTQIKSKKPRQLTDRQKRALDDILRDIALLQQMAQQQQTVLRDVNNTNAAHFGLGMF